jgi:dihydrolipoamide dehydrogenase|tara:strand:- start:495 stop:1916 length:1422 start_codon:yes stop_codon:yes gene_type:complete
VADTLKTQVLVLGGGVGGYSAAFRAADLGMDAVLVERYPSLGGVCLNVGCIPSKAMLHVAQVINEGTHGKDIGVTFSKPKIDLDEIRKFKEGVVGKLTQGVAGMAKQRKVQVVQGVGEFVSDHKLKVTHDGKTTEVEFENAIIAAGSQPVKLPFIPHDDPRVWDSTDALELPEVPKKLLVVGGGIIGLEMATVYKALGSTVDVVEFADQLIPAADKDLMQVYSKYNKDNFNVMLSTKVTDVKANKTALKVSFEGKNAPDKDQNYDAILVAVGRAPNGKKIGADKAGVEVDERGFIHTNEKLQTNVPHIYAIGDIIGQPMLAHKASHEGHAAAEVIAGHHIVEPRCIPSIAYTDPEVAWVGLTEKEAKEQGVEYRTAVFPWAASGRALGAGRSEGKTKLIYRKENDQLLGAGIVGLNAGELLGELSLALEFGASAEDLAMTVHAHPTLHETVGLAGELAAGTITDLPNPLAKKK